MGGSHIEWKRVSIPDIDPHGDCDAHSHAYIHCYVNAKPFFNVHTDADIDCYANSYRYSHTVYRPNTDFRLERRKWKWRT